MWKRQKDSRHRARRAGAPICDLTRAQWEEIKAARDYRCEYCGAKPARLTMDHVVAISCGGNHTASNIVPACVRCNSSKNGKTPGEVAEWLIGKCCDWESVERVLR